MVSDKRKEQIAAAQKRWHAKNPNYKREYREKNRERLHKQENDRLRGSKQRSATLQRYASKRRQFTDQQKARPCADCGIQYPPYVMHFDHRPGETKIANVSSAQVLLGTMERLMAEIAKCDVVCANCHAERTHRRRLESPI